MKQNTILHNGDNHNQFFFIDDHNFSLLVCLTTYNMVDRNRWNLEKDFYFVTVNGINLRYVKSQHTPVTNGKISESDDTEHDIHIAMSF